MIDDSPGSLFRVLEESQLKLKSMIDIGSRSIPCYIMKGYAYYEYTVFIVFAEKQQVINQWFAVFP